MNIRMKASHIRWISTFAAILLALPVGWGKLTGLYTWSSPFIMLNSAIAVRSFMWMAIPGILVLAASFYSKRWFCRYMCPVGSVCDLVSKSRRNVKYNISKVPPIGKWAAVISIASAIFGFPVFIIVDPMAIFNGFFAVFTENISLIVVLSLFGFPLLLALNWFFPGIWCAKICPLGGLQDDIADLKKFVIKNKESKSITLADKIPPRRIFLASGIGLISGLVIPKFLRPAGKRYFRPPSSLPENHFNVLCIRCGSCIKSCPSAIIVHHKDIDNFASWMTPEVTFSNNGYCVEDCNLCSVVCPSGAIRLFNIEEKTQIIMGSVRINTEKCLLTERIECDRCKTACSYKAISVEFNPNNIISFPVVDNEKCVGCGACAVICPPEAIEMLPV